MIRTRGREVLSLGRKKKRTVQRLGQRLLNHEPLEDRRLLAVVTDMGDVDGMGTLRDAIATGDAVITFDVDNVYLTQGQITISNDIMIDGSTAPAGMVTIDGGASGRIFYIDDGGGEVGPATISATIQDATIQNGRTNGGYMGYDGSGGAIRSFENLTLTRVTGQNNYAGYYNDAYGYGSDGGFLRQQYGTLTITDSLITNNRASDDAGGIDVLAADGGAAGGDVVIDGTTISNNAASVDSVGDGRTNAVTAVGGGLRVLQIGVGNTDLTISNSTLSGNTATALSANGYAQVPLGGGSLVAIDGSLTITDSVVSGNSATYADPNMYYYGTADCRGGGFYLADASATYIDGLTVDDNYACNLGPGLLTSTYNPVDLSNAMISNNYGPGGSAGGGIEMIAFGADVAQLTVSDSTITGNTSNFGAGVQVSQGSQVTLNRVNIHDNYSYASGAAVYQLGFYSGVQADNQTVINESTLSGNTTVVRGGGIAAVTNGNGYGGRLTVNNSTVSGNYSNGNTGGVYVQDSYATIYQSTVSGNYSTYGAGGVSFNQLLAGNEESNIDRSTITDNSVGGGYAGGVYGGYYSVANVSDSIISGNTGGSGDFYSGNPYNPASTYSYIGGNAMLGLLGPNGGPTDTHLPMDGSPVIDMADPGATGTFDQRGAPYGRVNDGRMDIGSIETGEGTTSPSPDINGDEVINCLDINELTTAIANGSTDLAKYDFNGDMVVNLDDITAEGVGWLALAGAENLISGNPYAVGDANLDGFVDGLDFIEWNAHKFTTNSNWCEGDFNADGFVDGLDFIEWNANKFTAQGPITVAPGGNMNTDAMVGELSAPSAQGNWLRQMTEPDVSRKHMLGETTRGASASAANDVLFAAPDAQAEKLERMDRLSLSADSGTAEVSTPFQPTQIKSERMSEISTSQANQDKEDSSAIDKWFAMFGTP